MGSLLLLFLMAVSAIRSLPRASTEEDIVLEEYLDVARSLIRRGFYNWLLVAIRDCFYFKGTFIVFDCPSGSGKTQTGVALLALAQMRTNISDKELVFAHFVWQSSVDSQKIYLAIQEDQKRRSVNVEEFFSIAEVWLKMPERLAAKAEGRGYAQHVWDFLLKNVFLESSMKEKFFSGDGIFVLMWDEIPFEPTDLALIGDLRDELKWLKNIVVILSGTNSMAANMIGLSTYKPSFSKIKKSGDYWSCLVTRMPKFFLDCSPHRRFWLHIQDKGASDCELESVITAISNSIDGNGNPRLINMAISALETVYTEASRRSCSFTFGEWQKEFSNDNAQGKFAMLQWSEASDILKAQANLLLAVSSYAPLADAVIHSHYGQRAFPDNGKNTCSSLTTTVTGYGGWLRLCPSEWQTLGRNLYSGGVALSLITTAHLDWQVSVFPPVRNDVLLYLGSCWTNGYFVSFRRSRSEKDNISTVVHTAMKLLTAFWAPNALGMFDFQNHEAPVNSGAMVEVLIDVAVMNAAAVSESPASSFVDFFICFLSQLEIKCSNIPSEMLVDKAFQGLQIPRYVFPGTGQDCKNLDKIGIFERTANADSIGTLHGVQGVNGLEKKIDKIHFEAKHRKSLDATKVMEVIKKILKDESSIGIMVTCSSSKFEINEGKVSDALVHLQGLLNGSLSPQEETKWSKLESKLGIGYFVNVDRRGEGIISSFTFDGEKQGRFIMVTLADFR